MSAAPGCLECRELLGGLVLGALDGDEARRAEEHLARCAACQAEHERIAALPGLLDLAGPEPTPVERPSPALEDMVVASYVREHHPRGARRRVWTRLAAGAAAAGLAAVVVVLALPDGDSDRLRLMPSAAAPGAAGTARLESVEAGTRVHLEVSGLPARGVYEVWFVRDGARASAGTFRVGSGGAAEVTLTAAVDRERFQRMGVTREPDAADPARNGPNVLGAPLAP